VKYCKEKNEEYEYYSELYTDEETDEETDDDEEFKNCCFRCGRDGHYATSCYASKHIKGYYLK
jgi:hypothetical protein